VQPKRNEIEIEAKLPKLKVSIVKRLRGNVASRPRAPPRAQRRKDSPRNEIRISDWGNPRARSVPISRVRELAAANMAPKVKSTAIRVPAALRKRLIRD